jgi:prevent-host-death family protein
LHPRKAPLSRSPSSQAPWRGAIRDLLILDESTRPDQVDGVKVINVQEAKTHLSRLIDAAAAGETVLLGKHGKPMAKLSAYIASRDARKLGGYEGKIRISPDFDEEDERINRLFSGG